MADYLKIFKARELCESAKDILQKSDAKKYYDKYHSKAFGFIHQDNGWDRDRWVDEIVDEYDNIISDKESIDIDDYKEFADALSVLVRNGVYKHFADKN